MKTKLLLLILILGLAISCEDDPVDPVLSTETDIISFSLTEATEAATINSTNHTIDVEVDNGTDLANLSPTFALSTGATSVPSSGTSGDYTSELTINVTAEDGVTKQAWKVNVTEADPGLNDGTDILTFSIPDETGAATINDTDHTIAIEVANGSDLSKLIPEFTLSADATSVPASGTEGDYSSEVTITVTAEDGTTTQDWTVNVTEAAAALSDATDILTFSIPNETGAATIDESAHTIATEMPNGTDLTTLIPEFTLSADATSVPASGTEGDYSSEVTITVTAEDGTTMQDWTVNVSEASGGGGTTTVEFADGGVKATAIRNLDVDGVIYDVEFRLVYPQQIYGDYPGTYTFDSNDAAVTAVEAVNVALNNTDAATVGEEGGTADEGRYRIGYMSFIALDVENTRFKVGIFEPTSWREFFEETSLYNLEPLTFAEFTEL